MRYPYRAYVVVADAEVEAARALVASELGPVEGANWFSIKLKNALGQTFWASSSVLTEANVNTIVWYQSQPEALATLKYVIADAPSGDVVARSTGLALSLGVALPFGDLLSLMGLSSAVNVVVS